MNTCISVDTAAVLTGMTKRTLWRWLGDGTVRHQGTDARGRTLLEIGDIRQRLRVNLAQEDDLKLLLAADQGDSEAQNELGILCLEQDYSTLAVYWFQLAAEQEHADAMHFLSMLYLHGTHDHPQGGVEGSRKTPARRLCGCLKRHSMATSSPSNNWLPGRIGNRLISHGGYTSCVEFRHVEYRYLPGIVEAVLAPAHQPGC